jgi:hypothetical protein
MRKTITVTIEGREYKVYELKVKEIWEIGQAMTNFPKGDEGNKALLGLVKEWLPKTVSLQWEEAFDLAPSELEELWSKFMEVNKSFLSILGSMGLKNAWGQILKTFQSDLSKSWQGLLTPGM